MVKSIQKIQRMFLNEKPYIQFMYDKINLLKHSERVKSELIIGSKLLVSLGNFKEMEFNGALKMLEIYFNALRGEIGIAYNSTKNQRFIEILNLISGLDFTDYEISIERIARAVSTTTTLANEAYQSLFGDRKG